MSGPSGTVYNLYGDCGVVTVTEKYAARDPEEEIKKVGRDARSSSQPRCREPS